MKLRHFSLLFPIVIFNIIIDTVTIVEGFIQHEKYKGDYDSNIIQGRYIVELNDIKSSSSQPSFVSTLKSTYNKEVQLRETFNHRYFKGMTFDFNDSNPDNYRKTFMELLNHHQVKKIYPIQLVSRPEFNPTIMSNVRPQDIPALSPHNLTQVNRVHKELKNTGKGITVCILDTGVDYNHPALGGGFGKGYKVVLGEDLVGDSYDGDNIPDVKPGTPPLDNCGKENSGSGGHGTHVSGIIAGKFGNFVGVAPDASLGMFKIFGCKGSSSSDIVIKGLLAAADAKCDIINLSLGSTTSWGTGLQADIVTNIVNSGIPVIAAAGNEGATGAFTISNPGSARGAMSVSSFNNENQVVNIANVIGASISILYYGTLSSGNFTNGEVVIGTKNIGGNEQSCEASDVPINVKGKYALVKRNSCTYEQKANNVKKAGAIGLIVYNDPDDDPFFATTGSASIPFLGISKTEGLALIESIKKGKVSLTFNGAEAPTKLSIAKTTSFFSGVGATYDLELHPHIGGIGGYVYSTLPTYMGSWGTLSGTSMSTPYISGCTALFMNSFNRKKKEKKKITPYFILEQLQHYAYKAPKVNGEHNIDSPLHQGAGLVQIFDSIKQKVHITPGQISFNDTSSFTKYKTQTITITNHGNRFVTYQVINNASLSIQPYDLAKTGYAFAQPIGYTDDKATLIFSKNRIRLAPHRSTNLTIIVIPPNTDPKEHIMYGGYIQLKSIHKKSSLDLTVPYFGIVGKQKELSIFDTENGYPYLSSQPFGIDKINSNQTFIMHRNDTLYMNYRLLIGSANIEFLLLDTSKNKNKIIGEAYPTLSNAHRHVLEGEPYEVFSSKLWNGTYYPHPTDLDPVPAPAGTYVIQIKTLRQFGDLNDDNDYDIWISPPIKIVG